MSLDVEVAVREQLHLVAVVAAKLRRDLGLPGALRDDLQAAGHEGLVQAASRFDASRGVPFGAFAYYRIRGAMIDSLRSEGGLPYGVRRKLRMAEVAQSAAEARAEELPAEPLPPREADAALARHLAAVATAVATGLVGAPIEHEDGQDLADDAPSPEDRVLARDLAARIRAVAAELPPPQGALLIGHHVDGRTLDDLGAEHGLSKGWASRLLARAVDEVRNRLSDP